MLGRTYLHRSTFILNEQRLFHYSLINHWRATHQYPVVCPEAKEAFQKCKEHAETMKDQACTIITERGTISEIERWTSQNARGRRRTGFEFHCRPCNSKYLAADVKAIEYHEDDHIADVPFGIYESESIPNMRIPERNVKVISSSGQRNSGSDGKLVGLMVPEQWGDDSCLKCKGCERTWVIQPNVSSRINNLRRFREHIKTCKKIKEEYPLQWEKELRDAI